MLQHHYGIVFGETVLAADMRTVCLRWFMVCTLEANMQDAEATLFFFSKPENDTCICYLDAHVAVRACLLNIQQHCCIHKSMSIEVPLRYLHTPEAANLDVLRFVTTLRFSMLDVALHCTAVRGFVHQSLSGIVRRQAGCYF